MFVCIYKCVWKDQKAGYTLPLGIMRFMWRPDACLEVHMNGLGVGGGSVLGRAVSGKHSGVSRQKWNSIDKQRRKPTHAEPFPTIFYT